MADASARETSERSNRRWGTGAVVALGAIPVGLLISGILVWQSSFAAFNAVADGGSNTWSAGTVSLHGDDGSSSSGATGTAMFAPTNMKPGSTGSNCVLVTYDGSLASAVKLYIKPGALTGVPMATQIDVTIAEGTGGSYNSCAGFVAGATAYTGTLAALSVAHSDFASGVGSWTPNTGQTKTYQITYTLKSTAPNSVQGASSSATVTWEAQNT
jgi:hypothetical protein